MTEERELMMWAANRFADRYLIGCFALSALVHAVFPAELAVMAAGFAYTCTLAKAYEDRVAWVRRFGVARILFFVALMIGAAAIVAVIFRGAAQ